MSKSKTNIRFLLAVTIMIYVCTFTFTMKHHSNKKLKIESRRIKQSFNKVVEPIEHFRTGNSRVFFANLHNDPCKSEFFVFSPVWCWSCRRWVPPEPPLWRGPGSRGWLRGARVGPWGGCCPPASPSSPSPVLEQNKTISIIHARSCPFGGSEFPLAFRVER